MRKALIFGIGLLLLLGSCKSDSDDSGDSGDKDKPCYLIRVSVSGLMGSGLILQNNSGDDLAVTDNASFTFNNKVRQGSPYSVTVKTQPANRTQKCLVSNGSGVMAGHDVTTVSVKCDMNWVQDAYVKASNNSASVDYYFGNSVALNEAGDLMVIGAYSENNSFQGVENEDGSPDTAGSGGDISGAVYLLRKNSNGEWYQDAYLKASNATAGNCFGGSVAINKAGDMIVVGASMEKTNSNQIVNGTNQPHGHGSGADKSGAVYVFKKSTSGEWYQSAYLKASDNSSDIRFGNSVSLSGDTIVVGAYYQNSSASGVVNTNGSPGTAVGGADKTGAAYIFKQDTNGDWYQDAYLKASNNTTNNDSVYFGNSVSVFEETIAVGSQCEGGSTSGVINNNNQPTGYDNGKECSGAVYLFKKDTSGDWYQDAYLKASDNSSDIRFGVSVALSGNTLVVGSDQESNGAKGVTNEDNTSDMKNPSLTKSGAAYIFKQDASGDWLQDAYLKASNSDKEIYFGESVAILGEVVAIGAYGKPDDDKGVTNTDGKPVSPKSPTGETRGAVYLYKKASNGDWLQDAYLKASNTSEGYTHIDNQFGRSVAVAKESVAVGDWYERGEDKGVTNTDNEPDTGVTNSHKRGAVYVFRNKSEDSN